MKKVELPKKVGPDEEEIFLSGWTACDRGTERHRNPYNVDTEAYEWWRRGWEVRYYNEPREKL